VFARSVVEREVQQRLFGSVMSHFEYVSVAIAMLYSLGFGKVLGGIPHIANRERGSLVVFLWVFSLLMGAFTSWWSLWQHVDVEWTAFRFMVILGTPILFYTQAALLVPEGPSRILVWDDYYATIRKKFISVFTTNAVYISFVPWALGETSWFAFHDSHVAAAVMVLTGILAYTIPARRIQLALGALITILATGALFVVRID